MKRAAVPSILVAVVLLALGVMAEAQQPTKIPRIGFLDQSTASGMAVLVDAFRQELIKLGWVEGKSITIEYRFAEGKTERIAELAADLVRLKVDLIVVASGPPALAVKEATTTIPIVMANVADPVGAGLIASLARPGGNVTGLSRLGPDLAGKTLALLKEAVPKAASIAVLSNPLDPVHPELVTNTKRAARALGVQLKIIESEDARRSGARLRDDGERGGDRSPRPSRWHVLH